MTAQDVSLVQKPLTMDILMRIVTDEGQTKAHKLSDCLVFPYDSTDVLADIECLGGA